MGSQHGKVVEETVANPHKHRRVGEGHQTISWIWMSPGLLSRWHNDNEAVGDHGFHEGEYEFILLMGCTENGTALQVEWCQSRAQAQQWREEAAKVHEEMRCVEEFFKWKAAWWEK